jgi:hypothetical protein
MVWAVCCGSPPAVLDDSASQVVAVQRKNEDPPWALGDDGSSFREPGEISLSETVATEPAPEPFPNREDLLDATEQNFVQGLLSAEDRAYQTRLLRDALAFRRLPYDLDGEAWETHLGDSCSMAVNLAFLGVGKEAKVRFKVVMSNFEAETLHLFALAQYPDLWPTIIPMFNTVDILREFALNDFFIAPTVRVPIPLLPSFHNIGQIVRYDLMDEAEAGVLIAIEQPKEKATTWRGVDVPPVKKGCKRVYKEMVTGLLKLTNKRSHDVEAGGVIDLKVPRWLLTSAVMRGLINIISRQIYYQIQRILAKFESTEFARRMKKDESYFDRLRNRLVQAQSSGKA